MKKIKFFALLLLSLSVIAGAQTPGPVCLPVPTDPSITTCYPSSTDVQVAIDKFKNDPSNMNSTT